MSLTSILKDFAVRAGLIVEGTNNVTSSTGMTGTLQVNGGAAIAKNLIVGEQSTVWGNSTVKKDFTVEGAGYLAGVTATGIVNITDSTAAQVGAGALKVSGGAYVANNLVVGSTATSESTTASNSLYVAGGLGVSKDLLVGRNATIVGNLTVSGETTYVESTNTVYTDNIIELHTPPSGPGGEWASNDGKDIGLRFHYYNGSNQNAFLGYDNSTGYLEWLNTGAEGPDVFTGGTFGTFKTGSIKLSDTTTATSTNTGVLTVEGGAGIAKNVYVGSGVSAQNVNVRSLTPGRVVFVGTDGILRDDGDLTYDPDTNLLSAVISSSNTATSLAGGAAGSLPYQQAPGVTTFLGIGTAGYILVSDGSKPTWSTTGTIVTGNAVTATNLQFGAQYQIPYQTGSGSTAFEAEFTYNYTTNTLQADNVKVNGNTNATTTNSGALQVIGGVGVGNSIYVGGNGTFAGDLAVNGGNITSSNATFNVANSGVTTLNLGGAATAVTVGATTGYTAIRNLTTITNTAAASSTSTGALRVEGGVGIGGALYVGGNTVLLGDIDVRGGDLTTNQTTFNLVDATATTVNFARAATALTVGATTGYTAIRNLTTLTNTTAASSTNTGALRVEGGVGIGGALYVGGTTNFTGNTTITGDLAVNGGDITTTAATFNLVDATATTVNFARAATALTMGATTGYTEIRNLTTLTNTTNATTTATGALQVRGGAAVGLDLVVGGDLAVNGGDFTSAATTFNLLNATVTTANVLGAGTAITLGAATGYTAIRNLTTLTNTTNATSTNTGALQVRGGVGVADSVWIGNALRVVGNSTFNNVSAAITTASQLTVSGAATIGGIVTLTDATNSNTPTNGALKVAGGVGIVKDVVVGGTVTAGVTQAATTGTVVNGFYTNNTLISSFTSNVLTGSLQVDLDFWSATLYRSARYFVQITDGSNIHISEISLFHDGTKAYLNEYGIATNNGQLGSFDAALSGGNVVVRFTPTSATAMTVKMVRTTLTI